MSTSPPNGKGASGDNKDFSFPKELRLSGKKDISELFSNGSFFYLGTFKIYHTFRKKESDEPQMPQVLIAVPKSKVPKANSRTRVKRRMREAFRLNKHILLDDSDHLTLGFDKLGFIYQHKGVQSYREIEDKLKIILKRLASIRKKKNEED